MCKPKPVIFMGRSLRVMRGFSADARHEVGHQLDKVQRGLQPSDWKPLALIGQGVRELRIRELDGIYRVIYIAKFQEAIYVLHAFQKKTQRTNSLDLEVAKCSLALVKKERKK
jgi:phage-related protein